jgi:agmatinase
VAFVTVGRGTYLSARRYEEPADAVVLGAPFEGGISFRPGAAEGPAAIRYASQSIESYSPRLRRDLEDIRLADAGDVTVEGLPPRAALDAVAAAVERLAREGALPLTLGGDHSISVGTSEGLRRAHGDLAHVVFDAHFDLRETYEGSELSHACGTRRMALAGPTAVLGVRSGAREEYRDADALLAAWSDGLALPEPARKGIGAKPVFLSIDLDVLDPSILPGTGNPEPGGPSYVELREAILALTGLRIVGIDLAEVSPSLDPTGVSAVVAAELAREMLLAFAGSPE